MRRLKALIPRIARGRSNVLVQGESGTGKELVARAVHRLSPRAAAPFVAENCASLPDGVVESELFGHVRGAFTGAERDRQGLIALADGGTLFLDEIGDLGARVQAKLLRVIQEGEYRPVGGHDVKRSDFRVIAATHRDLAVMVERGQFREDLYYRINVVRVQIPPLRERVEDVPILIDHTICQLVIRDAGGRCGGQKGGQKGVSSSSAGMGRGERGAHMGPPPRSAGPQKVDSSTHPSVHAPEVNLIAGVSREALEMLLRYPWPGNVRELQNVVEAGLLLAGERGVIGVAELPERVIDHALAEPDRRYDGMPKAHEQVMIELALSRFRGDKAKTARHIGWTTSVLEKTFVKVWGEPFRSGREGWLAAA